MIEKLFTNLQGMLDIYELAHQPLEKNPKPPIFKKIFNNFKNILH